MAPEAEPRPETGTWPSRRSAALDWLVNETRDQPFLDNLFAELCQRLRAEGVPLERATMHLRTLHPQFQGARVLWRPDLPEAKLDLLEYGIMDDPRFVNSPVRALYEGAEGFRQRLDLPADIGTLEYAIYADLREQGYTDYVALPMQFTDGRRHATSWSTRRPGGFSTADLVQVNEILPVLQLAVEIRANRRVTKNLLNTYVGEHAGGRILSGEIRRGSGATVRAAIWNCDLRGFTRISEQWPRDEVITWLNEYFDVMAAPVEKFGGEILKFVGDGMLAIFRLENPEACNKALQAAVAARLGMKELNQRRIARGSFELGFGVALHVGDVMYGNIGTATRLDFTVIGPAVNVASRMQTLTKELRRQVLLSAPFAFQCGCSADVLQTLGKFPLRGVDEPLEIFGLSVER
ncbi:MAG: adenylate/guanylate cyclase domain-containing protein [Geminicoccaceae bacterium]